MGNSKHSHFSVSVKNLSEVINLTVQQNLSFQKELAWHKQSNIENMELIEAYDGQINYLVDENRQLKNKIKKLEGKLKSANINKELPI